MRSRSITGQSPIPTPISLTTANLQDSEIIRNIPLDIQTFNHGYTPRIRKTANKEWIERKLMAIIHHALNGMPERREMRLQTVKGKEVEKEVVTEKARPRDPNLARMTLMDLARLKGYVIEQKKSVSAKLDFTKMNPSEIREMLGAKLNELEPGARAKIELLTAGGPVGVEADDSDNDED